jgi:hypothetical protein
MADGSTETDGTLDGTADGSTDMDGVPDGAIGMNDGTADGAPLDPFLDGPFGFAFLLPSLPLPSFLPFPVGSRDGSTVGTKEDVGAALPFLEVFFFLDFLDLSPLPPFSFPLPTTLGDDVDPSEGIALGSSEGVALGSTEGIMEGTLEGTELGGSCLAETKRTDANNVLESMTMASKIGRIAAFTIDEMSLLPHVLLPLRRCR